MHGESQSNLASLTQQDLLIIISKFLSELNQYALVEKPMTKEEAAKFLHIGVRCLEKRLKRGVIPATCIHRHEGSVYFLPSELLEAVRNAPAGSGDTDLEVGSRLSDEIFTPDEAAEFVRYKRSTFDTLVSQGKFKPHRITKNADPKFIKSELLEAMRNA